MSGHLTHFQPPLPDALYREKDFFSLYPLDGGGYFIHSCILGTLRDEEICDKILSGALDEFGTLPELDFRRFEDWSTIEKTSWINRLYFLVPMAKTAMLRNDRQLGSLIRKTIFAFYRNNPPPESRKEILAHWKAQEYRRDHDYNLCGITSGPADYQWFDFQVASRVIHILLAAYFLRGMELFDSSDLEKLDTIIRDHARVIHTVEAEYRRPEKGDNHQVIRALALIYAASYFEIDTPSSAEWMRLGVNLIDFHLREDYFPDGLLAEISPSYHMFETWMGRDAALLASRHSFPLSAAAERRLENAFLAIERLLLPSGCLPAINDGYPFPAGPFRASLPQPPKVEECLRFSDAGIAVCRRNPFFVLLDASPGTGQQSHYHAGKNAITFWCCGIPFLIDSGCCSYDDPDFSAWFKTAAAHSSLLVNGQGDGVLRGLYDWETVAETSLSEWKDNGETAVAAGTLRTSAPGWEGVAWTREVRIDSRLTLLDTVTMEEEKELCFSFVLDSGVSAEIRKNTIRLRRDGMVLRCDAESTHPMQWKKIAGKVFTDSGKRSSQILICTLYGQNITLKTCWSKEM